MHSSLQEVQKEDNGGRKKEDRRRKGHNGERIGLGKYREEGEGRSELKKGDRGRGISGRGWKGVNREWTERSEGEKLEVRRDLDKVDS